MFRVVYIDRKHGISHKGGFESPTAAYNWIIENDIKAIKLLVWDEDIQCFKTIISC